MVKSKCQICHGTGLLPFVKDGRVIPFAFQDCECKDNQPEHFIDYKPGDFDFPCSDTYRGYFYNQCGIKDPGYYEQTEKQGIIPDSQQTVIVKHHYINQATAPAKGVTPVPVRDREPKALRDISYEA